MLFVLHVGAELVQMSDVPSSEEVHGCSPEGEVPHPPPVVPGGTVEIAIRELRNPAAGRPRFHSSISGPPARPTGIDSILAMVTVPLIRRKPRAPQVSRSRRRPRHDQPDPSGSPGPRTGTEDVHVLGLAKGAMPERRPLSAQGSLTASAGAVTQPDPGFLFQQGHGQELPVDRAIAAQRPLIGLLD
jgi:hypothetical protein